MTRSVPSFVMPWWPAFATTPKLTRSSLANLLANCGRPVRSGTRPPPRNVPPTCNAQNESSRPRVQTPLPQVTANHPEPVHSAPTSGDPSSTNLPVPQKSCGRKACETVKQLSGVQQALDDIFVGRTDAIEILRLATVCQEHALIVGPPGTAKTQLITRFTQLVDATGFHYLLTRFTEPAELFGPLDLTDFQKANTTFAPKACSLRLKSSF